MEEQKSEEAKKAEIQDKIKCESFPEKKGGTMSALRIVPTNIKFDTQNEGEKVFILSRAAFITNTGWILTTLFLFFAGFLVSAFVAILFQNVDLLRDKNLMQFAIIYLYYLGVFSFALSNFIVWYFNVYIVTDTRLIDYDYTINNKYKVSEANLTNIEDVTQQQVGIFSSIFNYGHVFVQTASEKVQFLFSNVPNPAYLRDKIIDLSELLKKEYNDSSIN